MILISGCLCGEKCRYDGKNQPSAAACAMVARGEAIPVCPEVLGGLVRPNPPAEIVGGTAADVLEGRARVINREGQDVTAEFIRGAERAYQLCLETGAQEVWFKTNSPSCGADAVYDGTFSGRLVPGRGVTAEYLTRHGIRVIPMDRD